MARLKLVDFVPSLAPGRFFRPAGHATPRQVVVPVFLGVVLLAAGVLKGYELATEPVAETSLLTSRWFLILLVQFELFLGLWLLGGLHPKLARLVALACFTGFLGISLDQSLSGKASCGCFGKVPISPWFTLVFDLGALAALWHWRPVDATAPTIRSHPWQLAGQATLFRNGLRYAAAVVVANVLLGVYLVLANSRSDDLKGPSSSASRTSQSGESAAQTVCTVNCDLGVVAPGTTLTRDITIANTTSSPWTLKRLNSTCACTVERLEPERIEPGGVGTLGLQYRAPSNPGPIQTQLTVAFQEPEAPLILVTAKGLVRCWAEATPHTIAFGDVEAGSKARRRLEIAVYEPEELNLEASSFDTSWLSWTAKETVLLRHEVDKVRGTVTRIHLTLAPPPSAKYGQLTGSLVVYLRGPAPRELRIPWEARITGPLAASPDQVFFGFVKPGVAHTHKVHLRFTGPSGAPKPREVSVSHTLSEELRCMLEPTNDPTRLLLYAVYKPGASAGLRSGNVEITAPGLPKLILPFRAWVKGDEP